MSKFKAQSEIQRGMVIEVKHTWRNTHTTGLVVEKENENIVYMNKNGELKACHWSWVRKRDA